LDLSSGLLHCFDLLWGTIGCLLLGAVVSCGEHGVCIVVNWSCLSL